MEAGRDCDAGGNAVNGLTNDLPADATEPDVTCVATVSLNGQISVDSLHEDAPNSAPGTCVLELNCTTSNNTDGSGAAVEQYASRLFQKTDFEEGVLITNRQFEESTAKANREVLETGDEVTASTHLRFREQEKIKESDCGKTVSEYTSSNEETHQSTTCSYAVVGDKVVKTAKTRRSSTTREVSRKNGGPESQEGIELDTQNKGPPFEIESAQDKIKMATKTGSGVAIKKPDKYKVSFHSDTSDSESESTSEDEIKPPMKTSQFKAKEPSPVSASPDTTSKPMVDNLTNGINGDVDKSSSSSAGQFETQSVSSSNKPVDYQAQNGSASLLDLDPFGIGLTSTSVSGSFVKSSSEFSEAKSEVKTSVNSSGADLLIDLRADSSAAAQTDNVSASSLNTNITEMFAEKSEQSISAKKQDLSLGENFSILTGAAEQKTTEAGGMQEMVLDEAQTGGISSDSKKTISGDIGDRVDEIKVDTKGSSLDGNEMNTSDSLAFGGAQKSTTESTRISAETQQETKTDTASESYRREKATLSENKMDALEEMVTDSRKKAEKYDFENESSDDLIKRVLEQARREREGKKPGGSRYRVDMEDDIYGDKKDNARSAERRRYDMDEPDDEPTLSETRISPSKYESKGANLYSEREGRYGGRKLYLAEDIEESMYSRRRESPFTGDMDDEPEYEASAREKARASWRQKQTAVYDDDEVFDSSSVHSSDYGTPYRQQYEYGRPVTDEDFLPQKREETDEIVKEKTADIRNVVDKQASVIHKLRRASESFDELTNEIKNLKQDMLEREVQRTIMFEQRRQEEQEEREREAMELAQQQREERAALYGSPARGGADDYEPYAPYSRSQQDMDSQYKRRAYGSPSRFSRSARGVEDDDEDDVLKRYSSVYAGYSKNKRYTRSQSLVDYDDFELGSKASDSGDKKPRDLYSLYSKKYADNSSDYDSKTTNLGEKKSTDYASLYSKKYSSENTSDYDTGSSSGYRSAYASRKSAKYQSAESDYKSSSATGSDYKGYDFSKPSSGSDYRRSGLKSEYGSYSSSRSMDRSSRANQFQRANTLADFDFDKPYESKFLRKVKERKAAGDDISASSAGSKREKPFKSRFLNKTFDSSDYSSKSSSRSASMSSATSGARASAKSDSATGQKDATEKQDS